MISILVSGDFVPNNRVYDLLLQRDFKTLWSNVLDIKSDYKILNLECPIITRKDIRPIEKHGPSLKSIPIAIEAIQYAGFNCVTLANNHLKDYDEEGIQDTLSVLERYEIDYVGGGLSPEDASSILYVDQNDIKFAIVNVCEEEFSIASERNAGANLDEPVNTYYRIKEARSNADYVILIIHGGPEHYNLPTPRMKAQYRFYVDIGADVVINHHQHCFSGYELYNGKPIFYGLGNLSFDSKLRDSIWNTGYMVNLLFSRTEIKFEILPYTQGDEKPGVEVLSEGSQRREDIMSNINMLNEIISNDELLMSNYVKFIEKYRKYYLSYLEPHVFGRILRSMYVRGFLPSFLSNSRRLALLDYIRCVSHRDRLIQSLIRTK